MWHGTMHSGHLMPGFGVGVAMLMLIFFLLVLAGIVLLIWLIASRLRTGQAVPPHVMGEAPLDIQKRRFASGEVTAEQFQDMRRTLEE
jgi:uncharacterized membrane protein